MAKLLVVLCALMLLMLVELPASFGCFGADCSAVSG